MTVAMTLTPDDLAFLARASALVPSYAKLAQAKQLIEEARAEMAAALAKLQAEVAPAKPAAKPSAKRAVAPLAYGVDLPPPAKAPPPQTLATVTALLKAHGPMSRSAVSRLANLTTTKTNVVLYALQLQGLVSAIGRGRHNRWTYHDRTPVLSDLAVRARALIARGRYSGPLIARALNLRTSQSERLLGALRYAGVITEYRHGNTSYWKVL